MTYPQTCWKLRELSFEKTHWLQRLRSLNRACAPDIQPCANTQMLSATELREVVLRAVRRCRQTNCRGLSAEAPSTSIMELPDLQLRAQGDMKPDLVPGGGFLFVLGSKCSPFLCWEDFILLDLVQGAQIVWSFRRDFPSYKVSGYAYSVLSDRIRVATSIWGDSK